MSEERKKVMQRFEERLARLEALRHEMPARWQIFHLHNALSALPPQTLKEARETKDRIINEAKEQAKVEASKILSETQAAIETQKMAAITDVKNQVGKLVIEVSEKVLRRELSGTEVQEAHIRGLVDEVKLN